jgi:hypothetical protein
MSAGTAPHSGGGNGEHHGRRARAAAHAGLGTEAGRKWRVVRHEKGVSVAPKMAGTMLIRQQGKLLMSAGDEQNARQMIDPQSFFLDVNISLVRMGRTTGSKGGRALTGSRPSVSLKG